MYKGGNSSTDESLRLAGENLKAEWSPQTFMAALEQAENNVRIRKNSMSSLGPVGVSQASPYLPKQPGAAPAAAAPGPGTPPAAGLPEIKSKADYDQLPAGASYMYKGEQKIKR